MKLINIKQYLIDNQKILREFGVIFFILIQSIEICFVEIFNANKIDYFRFVTDSLLIYLCYLKWESDYRDEELFPGIESEIPDQILKNLKSNRNKSKEWKVIFDIFAIVPHYYVQKILCSIFSSSSIMCFSSFNLRWFRVLYIFRLPKLFETLDHLLQGEYYTILRLIELSIYIFLQFLFTAALWYQMGAIYGFGATEFLPSIDLSEETNVMTKFVHCFHFALHKIDDSNPTNANEITFYFLAISIKSLTEIVM